MKKRIFLIILLLLSIIPVGLAAVESTVSTLKIHYYRYADDYDAGWNIWLWPLAGAGEQVNFDQADSALVKDDWGVVATVDLTAAKYSGVSSIGVIFRKGAWVEKDIDADRFITVPAASEAGILNVYFVEGDERMGYSPTDPNGPDRSDKIKSAFFSKENEVTFKLTAALLAPDLALYEDGVLLSTTMVITKNTGKITLGKNVDFGKTYELRANFTSGLKTYDVTFDGIYDSTAFEAAYGYDGNDLGAVATDTGTSFRLWAPISASVVLNLYDTGTPATMGGSDTKTSTIEMVKDVKGTWKYASELNLHGKYYTYTVTNGTKTFETIDPYAKSAGVNGIRGMIVDFSKLNPTGFTYDSRPDNIDNPTDAIIYELHVRDLTSHSSWTGPEAYRGKFLGLTVEGTTFEGVSTGLDHIKELGVTHVQLLPFFDFGVVDETQLTDAKYKLDGIFNWGYMPLNFNVPEGSYSTDPYNGTTRVTELKQVSQAFANNGIGLIMDVVYNHTGLSADSNFNLIIPGYFHRLTASGAFSNGSGTGNETASERYMVRKFIVDSTAFWATEYNISGFRFDLMALHDVETMNAVASALKAIDENILIYGEPWNGGTTTLPASLAADKVNLEDMPDVGAFNDDIRDGIKGSVFNATEGGFVQGGTAEKILNRIKYGVVGGIDFPGLDLSDVSYETAWHTSPTKTINYVSAHDNNTLYDKLLLSTTFAQRQYVDEMQKQANAIVLTSQGIPFLHAGVEFMRSKPAISGGYDSNSYESPDSVNQLRWDIKARDLNKSVFDYYKGIIALRKAHPAFRMTTAAEVIENVDFVYEDKTGIIAYTISNYANDDTWGTIMVIHNNGNFLQLKLPAGEESWNLVGNSNQVSEEIIKTYAGGATLSILEHETLILYQGLAEVPTKKGCFGGTAILPLAVLGLGVLIIKRRKH
ncbi:MAG TPA: type I pullulanase [Acholeplasmatales bacterium]|nr:type I pullulanase [Acholeplasmatales bacterium]